jgi:hypothetical protein
MKSNFKNIQRRFKMKNAVRIISLAMLAITFLFNASYASESEKPEIKKSDYSSVATNNDDIIIKIPDGISDDDIEIATRSLEEEFKKVNIDTEKIKKAIDEFGYSPKSNVKPERTSNTNEENEI